MAEPLDTPALPCPECKMRGLGGRARIGNRRNVCTTCNNWAQNVRRLALKGLKETHAEEFEALRMRIELDLYPQVMEDFLAAHPRALASVTEEADLG